MDLLDGSEEFVSPLLGRTVGSCGPGVVPADRYLQSVAHPCDRQLVGVVGDEREGQLGGLGKYAAAFFKRSRSALSLMFSARSRRSSSSAGVRRPCPGKASSPRWRKAFFQVWRRLSLTSSRRATSATENFCSVAPIPTPAKSDCEPPASEHAPRNPHYSAVSSRSKKQAAANGRDGLLFRMRYFKLSFFSLDLFSPEVLPFCCICTSLPSSSTTSTSFPDWKTSIAASRPVLSR